MNHERLVAPPGYGYGQRYSRKRRHLVFLGPFNMVALCGVRVNFLSETTAYRDDGKAVLPPDICPRCQFRWRLTHPSEVV
jgi:hypothetical protein